jgi:hypothetical protein
MLILAASALVVTLQAGTTCLHDRSTETPDQRARRSAAVRVARSLNTAEAMFATVYGGKYADIAQLTSSGALKADAANAAQGFAIRLDLSEHGYWFEVADQQDACGFRFVSNQSGVIFEAQPIR